MLGFYSNKKNRYAGIRRQVPFRPEWFNTRTSSSLVTYKCYRGKPHLKLLSEHGKIHML